MQERFRIPRRSRGNRFAAALFVLLAPLAAGCAPVLVSPDAPDRPPRLVIVSIDGLRPDAIDAAGAPTLQRLRSEGALAHRASTILPSFTLPSHTSMLTGVDVPRHGVTWNHDRWGELGAVAVPTALELARDAGCTTAAFFSKRKMRLLARPGSLDHAHIPTGEHYQFAGRMTEEAERFLRFDSAEVIFIHLSDPDLAGHLFGWMGSAYRRAVRDADRALARMLGAAGATPERTTVIVTSDHGGSDRTHGTASPEDRSIPWIAWGAGVRPGSVDRDVVTYDTAATILHLLGVPVPADWDGTPVVEALMQEPPHRCGP